MNAAQTCIRAAKAHTTKDTDPQLQVLNLYRSIGDRLGEANVLIGLATIEN